MPKCHRQPANASLPLGGEGNLAVFLGISVIISHAGSVFCRSQEHGFGDLSLLEIQTELLTDKMT